MFLFSKPKSVVELITADHNKARALIRQYQMPYTSGHQKQQLAFSIIREATMHSAVEDVVVLPAMLHYMGAAAPNHLWEEHQRFKEDLAWLSAHHVEEPMYDGRMQDVMEALVDHMREEEADLLPRFAATQGLNLGRLFEVVKRVAPTRPHPLAPNKPSVVNLAVNGAFAPLDWGLDMVRFGGAPPL